MSKWLKWLIMFGSSKRTKIESWEIELLRNTLPLLPDEYQLLEEQINGGLFERVSARNHYVSFTFDRKAVAKFENRKIRNYQLKGIKVFDRKSNTYLKYAIYVFAGLIRGYSITGVEEFEIDINNINVKAFIKSYPDELDYKKIEPHLNKAEKQAINSSDVYQTVLNNNAYFHIKDLEDGDFIGIDGNKNVYKISHDPFEITQLNVSIIEALNMT